jgi:hypothetical protein
MVRDAPNYPSGTSARGVCKRQGGGQDCATFGWKRVRQGFLTLSYYKFNNNYDEA